MSKNIIHISEAEAAIDFASLLDRVRAGGEIVIEDRKGPIAILHPAEPVPRTISECVALAKRHEEETGKARVLDPDFAADLEQIIKSRKRRNISTWE